MECTPKKHDDVRYINCQPWTPNLKDFLGLPIEFGRQSQGSTGDTSGIVQKSEHDFVIEAEIKDRRTSNESRIMRNIIFKGVSCTAMSNHNSEKSMKLVIGQRQEKNNRRSTIPLYPTFSDEHLGFQNISNRAEYDSCPANNEELSMGVSADKRIRELKNEIQPLSDKIRHLSQTQQHINTEKLDSMPTKKEVIASNECKNTIIKSENITKPSKSHTKSAIKIESKLSDRSNFEFNIPHRNTSSKKRKFKTCTLGDHTNNTDKEKDYSSKRIRQLYKDDKNNETKRTSETQMKYNSSQNDLSKTTSLSTVGDKFTSKLAIENVSVKKEYAHQANSDQLSCAADLDVETEKHGPVIANVYSLQDSCNTGISGDSAEDRVHNDIKTIKPIVKDEHALSRIPPQTRTETLTGDSGDDEVDSTNVDNLIMVTPVRVPTTHTNQGTSKVKSGVNVGTEENRKCPSSCLESPKKSPNENARFKIIKPRDEEGKNPKENTSDGCFACDICNMNIFKRKYDLLVHKANYHWS